MPDNRKRRGPEDPRFIAFEQKDERAPFCARQRIDELHLAIAIEAAGHGRRAVKAVLARARARVRAVSKRTKRTKRAGKR